MYVNWLDHDFDILKVDFLQPVQEISRIVRKCSSADSTQPTFLIWFALLYYILI